MHCKIIDYGTGNIQSVHNALECLGHRVTRAHQPNELDHCDCLVFPGQGAFGPAMHALNQTGLTDALTNYIASGQPFIGICLGFQLLFEASQESDMAGLGTFDGECQSFDSTRIPVPHMGWNSIHAMGKPSVLSEFNGALVYFVHSYFLPKTSYSSYTTTNYGHSFTSAIATETQLLTQFHPEKSGDVGLDLLQQFLQAL